jgi:hypothetical protein
LAAGRVAAVAATVSSVVSPSAAKAMGTKLWRLRDDDGSGRAPQCFLKGTLLETPAGFVAIETLRIGDLVMTAGGQSRPIKWVGWRRYKRSGASWPRQVVPVRIAAHALADNIPSRDLYLSPAHALLIDGLLIKASDLVNGASITHDQPVDDKTIEYFHVALDSHEAIMAEGTPVETLLLEPGVHENFSNSAEFARLYPLPITPPMKRFAPEVGYDGRLHMKALLRIAFGKFVPSNTDAERIYEKIAERTA